MPLFSDHSYLVGLLIMVHEDEVDGEEWRFIKLECCQMHRFAFSCRQTESHRIFHTCGQLNLEIFILKR